MTTTTPTPALADLDKPEIEQEWAKVDPATAFHLIERHAEDWADAGRMMEAWRKANSSALAPSPQIAEVAELPTIDTPEYRRLLANVVESEQGSDLRLLTRRAALAAHIDNHTRDAIAASRRAPAPASAGQAATALPDVGMLQFLTDVVTAAGLLSHGKRDKGLARRIADRAYEIRVALHAAQPAEGSEAQASLVAIPRIPTEAMLKAARDWSVNKYSQGIGNDAAIGC